MTLTEFLLARIEEDEAIATDVTSEAAIARDYEGPGWYLVDYNGCENARYGSRFNPTRMLAECVAKRQIVERLGRPEECDPNSNDHYPEQPSDWGDFDTPNGGCVPCDVSVYGPDPVLKVLASVYSDHPDYREEWKL